MAVTSNGRSTINPWQHKASGLWCIKRKGKQYYLGRTREEACQRYEKFANRIRAGLAIPDIGEGDEQFEDLLTVEKACNVFLTQRKRDVQSKELSQRSFNDYLSTCKRFANFVGKLTLVDDLTPDQFRDYRVEVAKTRNPVGVGNEVTRVKTIFNWLSGQGKLAKSVEFGASFCRPKSKVIREHRHRRGAKLFTANEFWMLTDEFGVHLRAMAFLGLNCGFGPADCSALLVEEVNFGDGVVAGLRPKTSELRFATLWPETVEALKLSYARRPKPAKPAFADHFFLDHSGAQFVDPGDANHTNVITRRTTQALQRLKLHEAGKSFYWLRHTFRTIADKVGDDVAVNWIMGHVDDRTAKHYIHDAPIDRIQKVTDSVRDWVLRGAE